MYRGCTNLSEITVNFSTWEYSNSPTYATFYWVENVAPTGTFICPVQLIEYYDDNRIPQGWEVKHQNVGVDQYLSEKDWSISITDLTIYISGARSKIKIFDVAGRLITCREGGDEVQISLPEKGVYIVNVGTKSKKIDL